MQRRPGECCNHSKSGMDIGIMYFAVHLLDCGRLVHFFYYNVTTNASVPVHTIVCLSIFLYLVNWSECRILFYMKNDPCYKWHFRLSIHLGASWWVTVWSNVVRKFVKIAPWISIIFNFVYLFIHCDIFLFINWKFPYNHTNGMFDLNVYFGFIYV